MVAWLREDKVIGDAVQSWRKRDCPMCGRPLEPWVLTILGLTTLTCTQCDRVIEAFDVDFDDNDNMFVTHHTIES